MLVVTIVANLVGGICYLFISQKAQDLMAQNPDVFAGIDMGMVASFLVPRILMAEAISLCIVFILSILITHTIAGPIYRLEQTAKAIADGDLSIQTRLRPRDEFKELADAFNDMCTGISARIRGIRQAVEHVDASESRDFGPIYAALDTIKLPEDGPGLPPEDDGVEDVVPRTP